MKRVHELIETGFNFIIQFSEIGESGNYSIGDGMTEIDISHEEFDYISNNYTLIDRGGATLWNTEFKYFAIFEALPITEKYHYTFEKYGGESFFHAPNNKELLYNICKDFEGFTVESFAVWYAGLNETFDSPF